MSTIRNINAITNAPEMGKCGNDQSKMYPIEPKIAPKIPVIIPMHTPNKPAANPNNPPKIPIQIGKVKIISSTINKVELERVIDI